jgi:hypothetical protein
MARRRPCTACPATWAPSASGNCGKPPDVLDVATVRLLGHPDGQLENVSLDTLVTEVLAMADAVAADLLLVFDEGGVSGHVDHRRATEAARRAGVLRNLPIVAWAIPARVARALNTEFGTTFQGRPTRALEVRLTVNRERQRGAIVRHRSQSQANPVLWRRLELLGDVEWVRLLDAGGGPACQLITGIPGACSVIEAPSSGSGELLRDSVQPRRGVSGHLLDGGAADQGEGCDRLHEAYPRASWGLLLDDHVAGQEHPDSGLAFQGAVGEAWVAGPEDGVRSKVDAQFRLESCADVDLGQHSEALPRE